MQESTYDDLTVSMLGQGNDPWGSNNAAPQENLWKPTSEAPPPTLNVQPTMAASRPVETVEEERMMIPQDQIRITVAPEKGGMVFKHVNYIVQSQLRRTSSLRRFSDFAWLYDTLYKRYPTRLGLCLDGTERLTQGSAQFTSKKGVATRGRRLCRTAPKRTR